MAAAALGAFVLWVLRWRPFRVEVQGRSMAPTLAPGDWVVAVRGRRPRLGDVVLVEHPERPGFELVKRVTGVPGTALTDGTTLGSDEWFVEGDAPDSSTDSRHFGHVTGEAIKGRIAAVYWPPSRTRTL